MDCGSLDVFEALVEELRVAAVQPDVILGGTACFEADCAAYDKCDGFSFGLTDALCGIAPALGAEAGPLAVGAGPILFLIYLRSYGWSLLWGTAPYEVILVLACTATYLLGRWPVPGRISFLLLLGHYAFWIWFFRHQIFFFLHGYGAMAFGSGGFETGTTFAGLLSGLAWAWYISRLQHPTPAPAKKLSPR